MGYGLAKKWSLGKRKECPDGRRLHDFLRTIPVPRQGPLDGGSDAPCFY